MTNEDNNKTEQKGEEDNKPLSIVDEAKAIRDEIVKAKEELKTENDRHEKNKAEDMLGGTSGGHVEAKEPEEISDVDYANKVMEGEIGDDKQ